VRCHERQGEPGARGRIIRGRRADQLQRADQPRAPVDLIRTSSAFGFWRGLSVRGIGGQPIADLRADEVRIKIDGRTRLVRSLQLNQRGDRG